MNTPPPDPFDRALAAYSARELARTISPPTGFADRTAAVVLGRTRWPWKAISASLLAGVLAVGGVVYIVWPKPQPTESIPLQQVIVVGPSDSMSVPDSPNIGETLSEAGSALAKLSRTTAEKATPRALLPGDVVKVPEPMPVPPEAQPGTEAIAAMPAAAKSGLDPVTGSTRRAINLFLRDTGLKAD